MVMRTEKEIQNILQENRIGATEPHLRPTNEEVLIETICNISYILTDISARRHFCQIGKPVMSDKIESLIEYSKILGLTAKRKENVMEDDGERLLQAMDNPTMISEAPNMLKHLKEIEKAFSIYELASLEDSNFIAIGMTVGLAKRIVRTITRIVTDHAMLREGK